MRRKEECYTYTSRRMYLLFRIRICDNFRQFLIAKYACKIHAYRHQYLFYTKAISFFLSETTYTANINRGPRRGIFSKCTNNKL